MYLAEIKGIRANKGRFRMTENEYNKALEYKNEYFVTLVLNMNDLPVFLTIENPANNLKFKKKKEFLNQLLNIIYYQIYVKF